MATATVCKHCKTEPVVRTVHVKTVGSVPVQLGLCACDYLRCTNEKCREILRDLPVGQNTCPNCKAVL